ncbi:hypothetical protein [Ramlibacter humi]|uniref:Quinol:cytochrome C oxidoreductase n=1 Tax=Ramlibacter humi TaxID=2530451 RepID=A0A4Z0BEU6_9BURK|nr:hypothetical protein [Ramlibacter humi]TFY97201.1 hypothetical protein EZ216_19170 [Ramlibacter humi]
MKRMQPIGIVLLLLVAVGGTVSLPVALACALAAWWWALGLVLGVFINAWMHVLTGGNWGLPVRATALALSRRLPWLLPGLVVVAAAAGQLYPWATLPAAEWTRGMARPGFALRWLAPAAFTARLVLYAVAWWWVTRPASLASKGRAAASIVVCMIATTLAGVDLLMSLVPGWYSTAFGLVLMGTQALGGAAVVVPLALLRRDWPAAKEAPVSRDIGNLLLMWVMSWGYLAFMQFLVIWAENIPREIGWYVPRLQTGWQWVGVALVLLQLAVPFVALLFRSVKDRPARLALVALLLLASTAMDTVWSIVPSVDAHSLHAWWLAPLAFAGMALLAFGGTEAVSAQAASRELRHA